MAPTVEHMSFIGTFASDALADAEITNQAWYKKTALCYWNSVIETMRYWNGSAWVSFANSIGARMHSTIDQSIGDSAWVQMTFNASRYDTSSFIVGNTFVVPTGGDGVYSTKVGQGLDPNATGRRLGQIRVGGTIIASHRMQAETSLPGFTKWTIATDYDLIATDVVDFRLWQNSGAALNTHGNLYSHWASIHRIGDG